MNAQERRLTSIESSFFGIRWLAEYIARSAGRILLGRSYRRTSEAVIEEYEEIRRNYLDRFRRAPLPLEEYLVSEADDTVGDRYLQILAGGLYSRALALATTRLQQHLIEALRSFQPESVIEFGCGVGRNLLALKSACPKVRCIGLELSQSSVELARLASLRYRLELEIHLVDVTRPVTGVDAADLCFSVHALEQIPDSCGVFDEMYKLARRAVVLLEPIVELYPWTPRGLAARIRARHLDRLRGLYSYLSHQGYRLSLARLLEVSANALNQTAEVHVLREPYSNSIS